MNAMEHMIYLLKIMEKYPLGTIIWQTGISKNATSNKAIGKVLSKHIYSYYPIILN